MTDQTPIERGAEALWNRMLDGLPETSRSEWRPWDNEAVGAIDWHHDARAVFDSIDIEGVAQAIHDGPEAQRQYAKAGLDPHTWNDCPHREQYLNDAQAVKDHLTRKGDQ